jgi:hypothetical protein
VAWAGVCQGADAMPTVLRVVAARAAPPAALGGLPGMPVVPLVAQAPCGAVAGSPTAGMLVGGGVAVMWGLGGGVPLLLVMCGLRVRQQPGCGCTLSLHCIHSSPPLVVLQHLQAREEWC